MSTTCNAAVALDYSGGEATTGTLFAIDFDMTSRGASIQFLSQYPHEEECVPHRGAILVPEHLVPDANPRVELAQL